MKTQITGNFDVLLTTVKAIEKDGPIIIAISGFSGSGKSTLTEKLQKNLEGSAHVHGDAFMVDNLNRRTDDWDTIDRARIIHQVLEPVRACKDIRYQVYDWDKNEAKLWRELPHPKYLLLEGVGTIHPDLLHYFDLAVWVRRTQEDSVAKAMHRDIYERGYDHNDLTYNIIVPNDRDYFEKHRPHEMADFQYVPD